MFESVLTSKGQTTIPKAVREALGVGSGDRICYVMSEGEVRILAVRPIGGLFWDVEARRSPGDIG